MKQNTIDEQALNNAVNEASVTNEAQLECAAGGKRSVMEGWTCLLCGGENYRESTRCAFCGTPRP